MHSVIKISGGIARNPLYRFNQPVNMSINSDECIAIVGDNGSGKSMLVDMITGKHPLLNNEIEYDFHPSRFTKSYDNIKHITFLDIYGTAEGIYYYQQRFNQTETDYYPTVRIIIDEAIAHAESRLNSESSITPEQKEEIKRYRQDTFNKIYNLFDIQSIEKKRIIMLSSGEQRKLQLAKVLITAPRVLIVDNPFIGLDCESRKLLFQLLYQIANDTKILLILVFSKLDDIPDFVTHIIEVEDMCVKPKVKRQEWKNKYTDNSDHTLSPTLEQSILDLPYSDDDEFNSAIITGPIVKFEDVTIKYGNRIIFNNLTFSVNNGEHWAISGPNGCGKSTLLSIIFADNPQAYSKNIILFGKKRGSGESIWDIKKHIGYVSPELHRGYLKNISAINIVASGLKDTIGLYTKPKPEQMDICRFWMTAFGIGHHENTNFLHLSNGEQRLVLLARAFVKDPSLIILDEPSHGLDMSNRRLVLDVVNAFCKRRNKSLIMVTHYENELPSIIDHKLLLS